MLKFLYDAGQPVNGDGGERPNAHGAGIEAAYGGGRLPQLLFIVEHAAYRRHYALAVACQLNSRARAGYDRKAELGL